MRGRTLAEMRLELENKLISTPEFFKLGPQAYSGVP